MSEEDLRTQLAWALENIETAAHVRSDDFPQYVDIADALLAAFIVTPREETGGGAKGDPMYEIDGNALLQTTDGSTWASEFCKRFGGDEDLMIAWFANAIETGRRAGFAAGIAHPQQGGGAVRYARVEEFSTPIGRGMRRVRRSEFDADTAEELRARLAAFDAVRERGAAEGRSFWIGPR